jgi:hypothetical protein
MSCAWALTRSYGAGSGSISSIHAGLASLKKDLQPLRHYHPGSIILVRSACGCKTIRRTYRTSERIFTQHLSPCSKCKGYAVPTVQQLVRKGRSPKVVKTKAPASRAARSSARRVAPARLHDQPPKAELGSPAKVARVKLSNGTEVTAYYSQ